MAQQVSKREQRLVEDMRVERNRALAGGHLGQCDGCPAGDRILCLACALCGTHCMSHGCGYSPHAAEAHDQHDD